jgi:FlaA1/EpsC-like NDP-sugar epimerase
MIERLNRGQKLIIVMVVDGITAATALLFSYWFIELTFDLSAHGKSWLLPVAAVVTASSFYFFGLYRTILRFANAHFFMRVIVSSVIVSGLIAAVALYSVYGQNPGFPSRVFILFAITLSVGASCSRLFARSYFESRSGIHRIPTIIYGAGAGGRQFFSAMRYGGEYEPVAFVDDDPSQLGKSIHGLIVFSTKKLETLIESKKVEVILLAMPALTQDQRSKIIAKLDEYSVKIKTVPHLSELISGKATLGDIHNLSIEDIMARPSVQVNEDMASRCITEKAILITGAGGSIGSELCRQILQRNPKTIVLFEMTESALFYIEQELITRLQKLDSKANIIPILGSVLDENLLKEVMLRHEINTVFHAAAYKHVPMLEVNPIEGVRNNVFGTKCVVETAGWANVESLVIISTDKAVNPTSLMGATKRLAELVVQEFSGKFTSMQTCMVRFGNVLGSSGSVVPTFQEQIKSGGPVTVTHPEMERYFMTIPEASQLVMQAGSMANKSEIFVLDMGEPERIYDLAKKMIVLSGFQVLDEEHPRGDIEIVFTQPRPGEKLYEELSSSGRLEKTAHPKISRSIDTNQAPNELMSMLELIKVAVEQHDQDSIITLMQRAVPEYATNRYKKKAETVCVEVEHENDNQNNKSNHETHSSSDAAREMN